MEEKIKEIISSYIKVPAGEINGSTLLNRSAVSSSIMLHRMYSKLSEEGLAINNFWDINTYNDLTNLLNGNSQKAVVNYALKDQSAMENHDAHDGIGIDIEELESMPKVPDFREDSFYIQNFAASEISYCILQKNPYASFAGLFAAKEALVKCNNAYKTHPFNTITITHTAGGKPTFKNFSLSISHTAAYAVAIAMVKNKNSAIVNNQASMPPIGQVLDIQQKQRKGRLQTFLIIISLFFSILSLLLILLQTTRN